MGKHKPINTLQYQVISISKAQILSYFDVKYAGTRSHRKIIRAVNKLSENDMLNLASKIKDDFVEYTFWSSLECSFEELFMLR